MWNYYNYGFHIIGLLDYKNLLYRYNYFRRQAQPLHLTIIL